VPAPLCARGGVQSVQFCHHAITIADFREKTHTPFLHCLQFVQNFFWKAIDKPRIA
jgi:hypothetical protein